MKINFYLFPVIFLFMLSLTGCAHWGYATIDKSVGSVQKTYEPTSPKNILLTSGEFSDRKYEVIGDISATVNKTSVFNCAPTKVMINDRLKEKAAAVGADAIIFVRYGEEGIGFWSWGSFEGKGRAIKFLAE